MTIGERLRQAREAAELPLSAVARAGNYSRQHLSNVEHGRKTASPQVVAAYEKALNMNRRQVLRLAAASVGSVAIGHDEDTLARDLFASIAGGDDGPLTTVQTTHAVDHGIRRLAVRDNASIARLAAWLDDGANAVLRVNAAGILAKTGSPEWADTVALALQRDTEARQLYVNAVRTRVGTEVDALSVELSNRDDSGARWCAAHLLATDGHTAALIPAMRSETSRENLRHMALALAGNTDARH
jgi:transcriptional regulator with XRE-family HTH domain